MFSQLHRYRFATLFCLLVGLAAGTAHSAAPLSTAAHTIPMHPLSFTEAWITISDRIEVKLGLFTDDIIRYDRDSDPLPDALSADEFNRILDRQTPELLRRMQLYVGGKRLTGTVTSAPDPWTSSDVIDVVGSANLKHTWSFEFQIPNSPVRSLTIRHSLSPPGIEQPGELRLHSRHKPWKQRIDAVIPPDLPYTVVYREAGNSTAATATANETTSRVIVSPFAITHEVTLPLTSVLSAFPDFEAGNEPNGHRIHTAEPDTLTVSQQTQLAQQLDHWIQQNTTVATNGQSIAKRMVSVQFFESGIIPEQPVPDANPAPLLLPGTLIGLRQTYARSSTQNSGSLILKSAFPGVAEIRCETIANNTANTSLQLIEGIASDSISPSDHPFGGTAAGDIATGGQTLHQWSTSPGETDTAVGNHLHATVSQDLISRIKPSGGLAAWSLVLLGLGLSLLAIPLKKWGRSSNVSMPVFNAAIAIGLVLILVGIARLPAVTYESRPSQIDQWMSAALETIYQSPQAPSEQQTVERLSHWLSDNMVESTYLTVCQQMAAEPEQATWTGIQTVQLHAATAAEVDRPDCLTVSCGWEVRGMAYHWGHAHQVTRRYSGVFDLAETGDEWKIRELTQLTADSSTTVP